MSKLIELLKEMWQDIHHIEITWGESICPGCQKKIDEK